MTKLTKPSAGKAIECKQCGGECRMPKNHWLTHKAGVFIKRGVFKFDVRLPKKNQIVDKAVLRTKAGKAGWEKEWTKKIKTAWASWKKRYPDEKDFYYFVPFRILNLLASELARQRQLIASEVESAIATTPGYIGDEDEAQTAINRWEVLRPKVLAQAAKKVRENT